MKKILLVATSATLLFAASHLTAGVEDMQIQKAPAAKKSKKVVFVRKTVKDEYEKCQACGLLHKKGKICRSCKQPQITERKTTKMDRSKKAEKTTIKKVKKVKTPKVKKEKKPKKEKISKKCNCQADCKCSKNCKCCGEKCCCYTKK